jgi:hypothetical protein
LHGGKAYEYRLLDGVRVALPLQSPVSSAQSRTAQRSRRLRIRGGGDPGLVRALYAEITKPAGEPLQAGLDSTVHSHVMTFAAEEARVTARTVDVAEFQAQVWGPANRR